MCVGDRDRNKDRYPATTDDRTPGRYPPGDESPNDYAGTNDKPGKIYGAILESNLTH